ncbi:MAG: Methyltransferase type 11 [Firmicutes bacterium]|nr:Methyltransferase type 11 [Bacillota bacterium]
MFDWYRDKAFPWLMKKNIGKPSILRLRKMMLARAYGNILEIGIGTGINLPLYPKQVYEITAVDTYIRKVPENCIKVHLFNESVNQMSFADNTFDTIVSTFSLCSMEDLDGAFAEMLRVLKPGGQLLFLEHGKSQGEITSMLQNLCNPIYNAFAYGCNINRDYTASMQKCGFTILECVIVPAPIYPRFLTGYAYMGVAVKPEKGV